MDYCSFCGSQLSSDTVFCDNCGVRRDKDGMMNRRNRKKGKSPIILATVAILLLVSAGLTYALIQRANPQNMYFAAIANGIQDSINPFQQVFGDNSQLAERMATDAHRNEITITGDATIPELDDLFSLQNSAIAIITSIDPQGAQGMASLALRSNGANVFQLEALQSDTKTGLRLPYLYNEYFYVENAQFGRFMRQLDPYYSGPDQLNNAFVTRQPELAETNVLDPYTDYIMSYLHKKHFTLEKGVAFQGKKYNKVTLTLSENEVKTLLIGLVDMMATDDKLLNYYAGLNGLQTEVSFDWEQGLKSLLKDIRQGIEEDISFPKGYKSELIIDSKNNIVHNLTAFTVVDSEYPDDAASFVYEATNWREKGNADCARKLTISDSYSEAVINWNSVTQADSFLTEIGIKGDEETLLTFKLETTIAGATRETDFDLRAHDGFDMVGVNGSVNYTLDQDLKRDYSNQDTAVALNLFLENTWGGREEFGISLGIKSEIEFSDALDFPQLSSSTATNLTDLNEQELMDILEDIFGLLDFLSY